MKMSSTVITKDTDVKDLLPKGYKFSFSGSTVFAGEQASEKVKSYTDLEGLFAKFDNILEEAGHKRFGYSGRFSDQIYIPVEVEMHLQSLLERGLFDESDIKDVIEKATTRNSSDPISVIGYETHRSFESERLLLNYVVRKALYQKTDEKRILGGTFTVTGMVRAENKEAMDEFKKLVNSVFIEEPKYEEFDVPLVRDLH